MMTLQRIRELRKLAEAIADKTAREGTICLLDIYEVAIREDNKEVIEAIGTLAGGLVEKCNKRIRELEAEGN